jgi:hypothetical protein
MIAKVPVDKASHRPKAKVSAREDYIGQVQGNVIIGNCECNKHDKCGSERGPMSSICHKRDVEREI